MASLHGCPLPARHPRHDDPAFAGLALPPATSARLAAAWPEDKRAVVPGAGHNMGHLPVYAALKQAIAEMLEPPKA